MKKVFLSITSLCATASLFSENLDYSLTVHDKKMQGKIMFDDSNCCSLEQDDIKATFELSKSKVEEIFVLDVNIEENGESVLKPCLVIACDKSAGAAITATNKATGEIVDEVSLAVTLHS